MSNVSHMTTFVSNIVGFSEPTYEFTTDPEMNARISAILNEAQHVFECHADGQWQSYYKPGFGGLLAKEISIKPSVTRKIIKIKNRVFSMVLYEAVNINKSLGLTPHSSGTPNGAP